MRSIFGPHICGDALDVAGKEVLTGSWRPDKQLELWDFESGNKVRVLPVSTSDFLVSFVFMLFTVFLIVHPYYCAHYSQVVLTVLTCLID